MRALEPYIGWKYQSKDKFASSFVFIDGSENGYYRSDTRHLFGMEDSSYLEVYRGYNPNTTIYEESFDGIFTNKPETVIPSYANFIPTEPNATTESSNGFSNAIAISLGENNSTGIPRGGWVLHNEYFSSPALYQCCYSDIGQCPLDGQ